MPPYVLDANAIHEFQKERISGEEYGPAHMAIGSIFSATHIALDVEQICYQEWIDCAAGKHPLALQDWVSDKLVEGKINLYKLATNSSRQKLLSFGLPQDDHKWIRLALGCGGLKLVTEDIDFFDPTKKNASAAEKTRLRSMRTGNLL